MDAREPKLAAAKGTFHCSFCYQSQHDTCKLIAGAVSSAGLQAFICAECIEICVNLIHEEKLKAEKAEKEKAKKKSKAAPTPAPVDDGIWDALRREPAKKIVTAEKLAEAFADFPAQVTVVGEPH
jgi:ATP-dependent Clp protease ATP-binding subunit ClpX